MAGPKWLPFENEIRALEELLAQLEAGGGAHAAASEEVRRIRRELVSMKKKICGNLIAGRSGQGSRHEELPQTLGYVALILEDCVEIHGDRAIGDEQAIRCGFARMGDFRIMLVGQQKGHTLQERKECFYGCAHPEGYRKALRAMTLAAKFRLPIICLIDTPGTFPRIGA